MGEVFPTEHLMARRKESEATVSGKGAGCGRSVLPLGTGPTPVAGADLLSVVESERATNHEQFLRHAADEADKSAQEILDVYVAMADVLPCRGTPPFASG